MGDDIIGSLSITKEGKLHASILDWLFFGILCEFMNEVAKNLVEDNNKNLKDNIEKVKQSNEKAIKELEKTIDEFDSIKNDLKDMLNDWKEGKRYRESLK